MKRKVNMCKNCGEANPMDELVCTECESPRLEVMTTEEATALLAEVAQRNVNAGMDKIAELAV